MKLRTLSLTMALGLMTACQVAPVTQPGPTPSGQSSSPAPTVSAGSQSGATPSPGTNVGPSAPAKMELVLGSIYNEDGAQLPEAKVEVHCDQYPALNQTLDAPGAYSFRAPVGAVVSVRAFEAGYSSRTQVLKVADVGASGEDDPNRLDFGGLEKGMLYALSQYPEISAITPANLANGVKTDPLEVTLTFSQPITSDTRDRLASILELHFPTVISSATPDGVAVIKDGTSYNNQKARVSWNADNTEATLRFNAPLVVRDAAQSAVTVTFKESADIEDYPENDAGRPLGRARITGAFAGTGASVVGSRVAPLLRSQFGARPAAKPSPDDLWGLTHFASSTFTFAVDSAQPTVTRVESVQDATGGEDQFLVTFSKPVRGFPEGALDGSALRPTNYRFVLGTTEERHQKETFEELDPAKFGSSPKSVTYDVNHPEIVILHLSDGSLAANTDFKLYVSPEVKDLSGNPVTFSNPGLSANVMQGAL